MRRSLLDDELIGEFLYFLEVLDLHAELDLVRKKSEEILKRSVMDSWVGPECRHAELACILAYRLKRPDLLPQQWQDDVRNMLGDEDAQEDFDVLLATAKRDWPEVERLCRKELAENPDDRNLRDKELLGVALHAQGDPEEALKFLRQARFHSVHSDWVIGGMELLDRLEERFGKAEEDAGALD